MGGYAAGEVASRIAVETIVREYEHMAAKGVPEALSWAIQIANKEIFLQAQQQGQEGMGTTVVCLALRGAELFVAHAGDSRAYIYRAEQLTQLTQDHTLVNQMTSQGLLSREEAENHPRRHVLTLALGRTETVTPELKGPIQLFDGDTLLLCSDGIAGYLRDTDIQLILQNNPGEPQSAAVALTHQADATGGNDNAVAIVIYVTRVGK
jgi:protein phosphatase